MLSPPSIAGHATEYTLYVRGPPLRRSLLALSTILVKGFLEVLLSLTFPSTFLGSTFLGRSCVLPIVEENGLEEILVGICRLLGEILGKTPAGLLSSSGLINLLSPNIQQVDMLL
jgi:hypothetical protein